MFVKCRDRLGRGARLGLIAVAAALAAGSVAAPALATAAERPTSPAVPAGAEPQAQNYLDLVQVPDGSRQVSRIAGPLGEIPDRTGTPACPVASKNRYWMVPVGLKEFDEFIAAHPPAWFTGFPPNQADGYVQRHYLLNPSVGRLPLAGIKPFEREAITLFYSPAGAARTAVRAMATSAGADIKCNDTW